MKKGYKLVRGAGKGSHIKLKKGTNTFIIPGHKELKKGMELSLRKQLERLEYDEIPLNRILGRVFRA